MIVSSLPEKTMIKVGLMVSAFQLTNLIKMLLFTSCYYMYHVSYTLCTDPNMVWTTGDMFRWVTRPPGWVWGTGWRMLAQPSMSGSCSLILSQNCPTLCNMTRLDCIAYNCGARHFLCFGKLCTECRTGLVPVSRPGLLSFLLDEFIH